jgi:hypothetical protein
MIPNVSHGFEGVWLAGVEPPPFQAGVRVFATGLCPATISKLRGFVLPVVPGGGFYCLGETRTALSTSCSDFCNLSLLSHFLEAF